MIRDVRDAVRAAGVGRRLLPWGVVAATAVATGGDLRGAAAPSWGVAVFPSGHEFSLEIAADPETRQRGYMFREQIGAREGMLFVFDVDDRHTMWMRNCRVDLDMIWLDTSFGVVDVASRRKPCPERGDCPLIAPARPARYVLEVAAGTVEREGLKVGDRLVVLLEATGP